MSRFRVLFAVVLAALPVSSPPIAGPAVFGGGRPDDAVRR